MIQVVNFLKNVPYTHSRNATHDSSISRELHLPIALRNAKEFLTSITLYFLQVVLINPLYYLYREGPHLQGFGFWYGQNDSFICAQISKYDPEFWKEHPEHCDDLIRRHFNSYVSLVITVFYLYFIKETLCFVFRFVSRRCRRTSVDCVNQLFCCATDKNMRTKTIPSVKKNKKKSTKDQ